MPSLIISILLGGIITIFDFEGDNNIASEASSSILKDEELVSIEKAPGDQGYYFKIDQKVKEEYIKLLNKAYYEGYYHENQPEEDEDKPEFEYNPDRANIKEADIIEWFKTKDYEPYLIKMLKAEIASSYPKLGDYEGEDDPKSEKNRELGNKIDPDGNYVAQGRTIIQRTKMGLDGTPAANPIELEYVPYEEFQEMLKRTDESAMEVLDYFSFKEDMIYYATYKLVIVEVNGVEVSRTFQLEENSVSYKSVSSMCNMPYNFLFAILQGSENPEWVMKVIDLLLKDENHELILMIQDQLNIVKLTQIETQYHAQKTVTEHYKSVGSESMGYHWVSIGESSPSYSYPAGAPIITTTVTTTYTNTAKVFIKKAKTWCIDFEQEATLVVNETEGEEVVTNEFENYTDADYAGLGYPNTGGTSGLGKPTSAGQTTSKTNTSLSSGTLLYTTSEKLDTKDFTWDISTVTEKRINYERFLGLWKNTKGEYEIGCLFDYNGKQVGYPLPKDEETLSYPPDVLSMENHQDIDYLIDALALHEDTQMHEELMKYYWNKYTGEEWYDVDLDGLLDFFDTEISVPIKKKSSSLLELIRRQLAYWEGTGEIKTNAEGKQCYVAYWDSYGKVVTIGHGVTTWEISYFAPYGITSINTGDLIPVEIVDAVEEQIIQNNLNGVMSSISGLKDYQYAALTIAYYNCPSLVDAFPNNYSKYWKDSDDKYGEPLPYKCGIVSDSNAESTTSTLKNYVKCDTYSNGWADYCHSGGKALGGLVRRRYYEWMLFQYGYDVVTDSYYKSADNLYDKDGNADDQALLELQDMLASYVGLEAEATSLTLDLSSAIKGLDSGNYKNKVISIGSKWYGTSSNIYTATRKALIFQCTWWAYGRGSQYLEEAYGYTSGLPAVFSGNGGTFYDRNKQGNYFNYGKTPKPHSLVSWNNGSKAGHVAFVEAVDSNYIYISHAGSGRGWYGVSRIPLNAQIWSGYTLNGYVYLDEPNKLEL